MTHYRHDARDMQREALMDDFSRNFLMPFDEVKAKYIDNGMQAEKTIDALVERYYVSELAARTQLGFVKKVWGEEWQILLTLLLGKFGNENTGQR